jgi:hypothetical protein
MSDHDYLTERLARQQIDQRVRLAYRARVPGQRRPRTRHRLASGLHTLADRLDA